MFYNALYLIAKKLTKIACLEIAMHLKLKGMNNNLKTNNFSIIKDKVSFLMNIKTAMQ